MNPHNEWKLHESQPCFGNNLFRVPKSKFVNFRSNCSLHFVNASPKGFKQNVLQQYEAKTFNAVSAQTQIYHLPDLALSIVPRATFLGSMLPKSQIPAHILAPIFPSKSSRSDPERHKVQNIAV